MDQVRSVERALGNTRGQALVEAALVMPILLLLLVGIMEFGRAWNIHQVVTDAARQGARKAAIWHEAGLATDSATAVVLRSLAAGSVNFNSATDGIVVDPGSEEATVTVEVEYQFFVLAPVMALAGQSFGNGKVKLKSSAVMRNE
jgi:Flp pilus assembly protein TadG